MIRSLTAALLISISGGVASASTELLTNGGFETGDFTGWTASIFPASNGTVVVTSGSVAPDSGIQVVGPSEGTFHSLTGQGGPGAYSVMQGFTVGAGLTSLVLEFDMFSVTDAGLTDGGLDPSGPATQLARVDILTAGAGAFDLGASIVHTVLAPFVDGPFSSAAYASYSQDILSFLTPGTSYQLRFAQSDNQGYMTMGVDAVSLVAAQVPLPAAGLLLVGGLGLIGGLRAVRKG
jgi:hypothetical protein